MFDLSLTIYLIIVRDYLILILEIEKVQLFFSVVITTLALPCFTKIHSLFYVNNKKVIPYNIYELLTPVALAH
jgi:hypothetical protein